MRRFVVVFKKELREMLTWQMLIPILLVMIIYGFLGRVINQEQQKQSAPQPVTVLDLDHSGTSAMLTGILAKADFVVTPVYQGPPEQVVAKAVEDRSAVAVMVIPEGFESGISCTEAADGADLHDYSQLFHVRYSGDIQNGCCTQRNERVDWRRVPACRQLRP